MNTEDELTARRMALKLTLRDAAALSNVKQSAIKAIEEGRVPRGAESIVAQYNEWLDTAEKRAAKKHTPAFLTFNAKAMKADPVLDDDGVQVPGMWLLPDRGTGCRYVMQNPTVGECAGWEPGRKFRVDTEPGVFEFQKLVVHVRTGSAHVDAFGGTSSQRAARSFRPEQVIGA